MRLKKLLIIFVLVIASTIIFSRAADADRSEGVILFNQANELYEKGMYAEAIDKYTQVLDEGYESPNIYFNLGNAYYRNGQTGYAILNYERARRMDPGDPDIKANYKFVKAEVGSTVLRPRGIWNWRPLKNYYQSYSVDQLLIYSSVFYILALIILLIGILHREYFRRFVAGFISIMLFISFNMALVWHKTGEIGSGSIVINPETEARYGPFESATVFFKLREGMAVSILEENGDWCKVRRLDGKKGWVRKEDIEII